MLGICLVLVALPAVAADQVHPVQLRANEVESMLYLFNQTTVSGGDVELIAQLGAKLKQGFQESREKTGADQTSRSVTLCLNQKEISYCLAIINRSTFPAKYVQLVLGMKKKLLAALPPAGNDNQ